MGIHWVSLLVFIIVHVFWRVRFTVMGFNSFCLVNIVSFFKHAAVVLKI